MEDKKSPIFRHIHKIILIVLIGTLLISGFLALSEYTENWKTQREYEKLAEMIKEEITMTEAVTVSEGVPVQPVQVPEQEPEAPYISPIDFDTLAAINPDVVGWIRIPDTNIDYPIVQSDNNDEYLHKSFEGEETAAGSIFLDFESQSDMQGYNNILYGHHMKNGSMFKDIVQYKEEDYFKEHQYFEIYTPKETIHLKAVSCYYIKNDPMVRRTKFGDNESFQVFVQTMLEPCGYAEIPEEPVSRLFTLVTCSYEVDDGRTVLFAVEADEEGDGSEGLMKSRQRP